MEAGLIGLLYRDSPFSELDIQARDLDNCSTLPAWRAIDRQTLSPSTDDSCRQVWSNVIGGKLAIEMPVRHPHAKLITQLMCDGVWICQAHELLLKEYTPVDVAKYLNVVEPERAVFSSCLYNLYATIHHRDPRQRIVIDLVDILMWATLGGSLRLLNLFNVEQLKCARCSHFSPKGRGNVFRQIVSS